MRFFRVLLDDFLCFMRYCYVILNATSQAALIYSLQLLYERATLLKMPSMLAQTHNPIAFGQLA